MASVTTKRSVEIEGITLTPVEWAKIETLIRLLGKTNMNVGATIPDTGIFLAWDKADDILDEVVAATREAELRG